MSNTTLRKIRLGDLKIDRVREDGDVETLPLMASPYYRALVLGGDEGKQAYEDYSARLDRLYPETGPGLDYAGFMALLSDIRTSGLRDCPDPIRVVRNLVYDGQHRLAIMLYLYGPGQYIEVDFETLVGLG